MIITIIGCILLVLGCGLCELFTIHRGERFMIIRVLNDDELKSIRTGDIVFVMISGLCIGLTGRNFLDEAENGTSRTG